MRIIELLRGWKASLTENPINYQGQRFGGPTPANYPSVAARNYAGFNGPQAPPPSIQAGGPAAIQQWQQQMSAVGNQAPVGGNRQQTSHGPTVAPPVPPQKPTPDATPAWTPGNDPYSDIGRPVEGNPGRPMTPGVGAYSPVGRPTEGNSGRTNTGPASAPPDTNMHWSLGTGMYRGGGPRDPNRPTVPATVPQPAEPQRLPAAKTQAPGSTTYGSTTPPGETPNFYGLTAPSRQPGPNIYGSTTPAAPTPNAPTAHPATPQPSLAAPSAPGAPNLGVGGALSRNYVGVSPKILRAANRLTLFRRDRLTIIRP
jgi:hypothetical protein